MRTPHLLPTINPRQAETPWQANQCNLGIDPEPVPHHAVEIVRLVEENAGKTSHTARQASSGDGTAGHNARCTLALRPAFPSRSAACGCISRDRCTALPGDLGNSPGAFVALTATRQPSRATRATSSASGQGKSPVAEYDFRKPSGPRRDEQGISRDREGKRSAPQSVTAARQGNLHSNPVQQVGSPVPTTRSFPTTPRPIAPSGEHVTRIDLNRATRQRGVPNRRPAPAPQSTGTRLSSGGTEPQSTRHAAPLSRTALQFPGTTPPSTRTAFSSTGTARQSAGTTFAFTRHALQSSWTALVFVRTALHSPRHDAPLSRTARSSAWNPVSVASGHALVPRDRAAVSLDHARVPAAGTPLPADRTHLHADPAPLPRDTARVPGVSTPLRADTTRVTWVGGTVLVNPT